MQKPGIWIGAILGAGLIAAVAITGGEPLSASVVPGGGTTAQAMKKAEHRFAPGTKPAKLPLLERDTTAYLSIVAGGDASGFPPVAAVREKGQLRLVRAGDLLDGAVVASIETAGLTMRTIDRTFVMPRAR